VAFPSISTGIYGYPIAEACRIALRTTLAFLAMHPEPAQVTFVCFSQQDLGEYQRALAEFVRDRDPPRA
jgi:O-acetyl-ADP-ribose deacetylase (regulator of RNase III)